MLLVTAVTMSSCKSKYPNLEDGIYAEFVTNKGTFVAKFYHDATPLTVANFVELAEGKHELADTLYKGKPFYDGLTFHRVMKEFMIQGGDPLGNGQGNPGFRFPDEFVDSLRHDRKGLLSMANGGPATNGSQFFVTLVPTPWLDDKHTIFGEIVIGQEVVDSIGLVSVESPSNKPLEPIIIETVTIINKGIKTPSFAVEMEKLEKTKQELIQRLANVAETTASEMAALKLESKTLESGLQIHWKHKGKGAKPAEGSKIKMNYIGYFADGKLFDTSVLEVAKEYNKVNPERLAKGGYGPTVSGYGKEAKLIPGFREGLNLMSIGDNIVLFIPSHLAYGEQGLRGVIPPNTDLVFELELVEIFVEQ